MMDDLPESVRAFVAVRIPPRCIDALTRVQQQLRPLLRNVSWTRPEAMHLTLHFLGQTPSTSIPAGTVALNEIAHGVAPFDLEIRGVGSFGNRVMWAGVKGDVAPLVALANSVRARLSAFGEHKEDRDYSPHVTLGRVRIPERGVAVKLRGFADAQFGSWRVESLELIRSELGRDGSRYTTLAEVTLRA